MRKLLLTCIVLIGSLTAIRCAQIQPVPESDSEIKPPAKIQIPPSPVSSQALIDLSPATPSPSPASAGMVEDLSVACEQALARQIHTRSAQTAAARPSFTPHPTFTPTELLGNLPTFTPVPDSTPTGFGSLLIVPPDVVGEEYRIENAYYFDSLEGRRRYEIFAGSMAGSGDEETALGVVVVRILQVSHREKQPVVNLLEKHDYSTPLKVGPVRILPPNIYDTEEDPLLLQTPLGYEFLFFPLQGEFLINPVPPRATLQVGEESQVAGLGSYCWLSSCLDGPFLFTSAEPLIVRSPLITRLRLPLEEAPGSLQLEIINVSLKELPGPSNERHGDKDYLMWSTDEEFLGDSRTLPLRREQEIWLSLEPGLYVLIVRAGWEEYGVTPYGFLLEVRE